MCDHDIEISGFGLSAKSHEELPALLGRGGLVAHPLIVAHLFIWTETKKHNPNTVTVAVPLQSTISN